jgi:UDP-N-acetyl-D-glucosamine dehydrogenase
LANDVNDHMPDYVVARAVVMLNRDRLPVNGSRILLLGLAYKPNSSDSREAPAVRVAERLVALGADVRAVDPHLSPDLGIPHGFSLVELSEAELAAADLVVLLTDHDRFDYDLVGRHGRRVLDTRNRVPGDGVERL